jgi:hypothetical protein
VQFYQFATVNFVRADAAVIGTLSGRKATLRGEAQRA